MSPQDHVAWEDELLAEVPGNGRAQLNRLLAAEPALQAEWVAQRRLVIRLAGLAPRDDTAARVLGLLRAQRKSRRLVLAQSLRRRRAPRSRAPLWFAAAAAVLLLAISSFWLSGRSEVPDSPQLWRDGRPSGETLASVERFIGAGELRWADGSRATLAPGTQVATSHEHGFRLLDGSVQVEVTPSSQQHFTVNTATAHVAVVGTRFDVAVLTTGTRVAVADGVVSIAPVEGSTVRAVAGDRWLFTAAGTPQREQAVWSYIAGAALLGRLELGTVQDSLVASGTYVENGSAQPCIQLEAPANGELFLWLPGQVLTARVQLAAPPQEISVQLYDRIESRNFTVRTTPTANDQGWADLTVSLDQLSPNVGSGTIQPGAPIGHLVLACAGSSPPFQLRDIVVVHR